jgi:hypothetical protein
MVNSRAKRARGDRHREGPGYCVGEDLYHRLPDAIG